MPIFEQFPYTNLHELNLDYILETQRKQEEAFDGVIEEAEELKNETSDLKDQTETLKNETADLKADTEALKNQTEEYKNQTEGYKNEIQGALNQIQTNKQNIAVNSARIDTFVELQDGSTTGDAELADIRVGANGVTYPTAGDAVRGQYDYLDDFISNNAQDTVLQMAKTIYNTTLGTLRLGGYSTETGAYYYTVQRRCTTKLALQKHTVISVKASSTYEIQFMVFKYTNNGTLETYRNYSGNAYTVTENGVYTLVFRIRNNNNLTDYEDAIRNNMEITPVFSDAGKLVPLMNYYDDVVTNSNYSNLLPDANNAPLNTIIRIFGAYNNTTDIPAHLPESKWPKNIWGEFAVLVTISTYPGALYPNSIQYFITDQISYIRHYARGSWEDWSIMAGVKNTYYVGSGQDYTSFSEAVIDCYNNHPDCTLVVRPGTYNIIDEFKALFGNDIWDEMDDTFDYYQGLPLGEGLKIIGTPGAVIQCNNATTSSETSQSDFSILMSKKHYNRKYPALTSVKGLKFVAENIRYCIHLEYLSEASYDTFEIEDCQFFFDDSLNVYKNFSYAIGLGAGLYTNYRLIANYFNCTFSEEARDNACVYYHNTSGSNPNNQCSFIDNYFDTTGTIRSDMSSTSTNNCLVKVIGNNVGSALLLNGNTENLKYLAWNNIVRE